jgi:enolase-phosphatase E1
MTSWRDLGLKIMIYSSGSVPAQKLLFGHTNAQPPDLTPLISGWFDTVNGGDKTQTASYAMIASRYPDWKPGQWLFLSDNPKEVKAAIDAGMQSIHVCRPGNPSLPIDHDTVLEDFTDLAGLGETP